MRYVSVVSLPIRLTPRPPKVIELVKHNVAIIPELPTHLKAAVIDSYADAVRVVFVFQIVCNGLVFVCCLMIQEKPLPWVPLPF